MTYRIPICIAALCAATIALCPRILPQDSGASSSVSTIAPQTASGQIKDLLSRCDAALNAHGDLVRAEQLARQARELSQKAGDKRTEAAAMIYLAAAVGYQGRANEALEVEQQTLVVARESGDKKEIEQALNSLGATTGAMGRYEESVGYFYALLALAREFNDPVMQYMSLLNLGEAYSDSGDPDRAEDPLMKALKLAAELDHGDPVSKAKSKKGTEMALLNLGGMEMARGHYAAAFRYYQRVHESKPGTPLWAIAALQGMGNADQALGKPQDAIPLLEQAIALAEKSPGGSFQLATTTSNLGLSQEATGQMDAALASQYRALNLLRAGGGIPEYEWPIESHIGHVLRAMGHNDEALQHYMDSISDLERLRLVALSTEQGHAEVLAISHDTYAEAADLLVEMHRAGDAFAMAERGRARAFLDTLAVTRGGLPEDLSPEQKTREQALLARVSSAQKGLWREGLSASELQQRKAKLRSAEEDLDTFQVDVRRSNPRYASLHYPEPADATQIQRQLLDDHTTLVEYLLGEKRSLVWVLSKDKLTVATLPVRKEVERQVAEYRRLLGERASVLTLHSSLDKINLLGHGLYLALLQPIRHDIPPGDRLIVVPDGALNYLPFETVVTGTRRDASGARWPAYALEQFTISYGPSASALLTVREMNQPPEKWNRSLLAFGDPVLQSSGSRGAAHGRLIRSAAGSSPEGTDPAEVRSAYDSYAERGFSLSRLPFTREEVLSIGGLFTVPQRQLYLGTAATKQAVTSEDLAQYRYIHFATHGLLDEGAPGRSGILFSRDPASQEPGVLQASEIMRLSMHADLVTLSACSTGLGQMVNGEGVLGLTRAFFYAGARNLTVSLWNVNDSATSSLMKAFYSDLNHGVPKADALRQAKLGLVSGSNPAWRNPYFWGPFVLVGDGN
ncbi:MAG TPA: CHAT domain-containing protein [Acidobacteriaceae bacterium]|nr:CHAT domain-containing protein [Acidobacteriaceae bacterium]